MFRREEGVRSHFRDPKWTSGGRHVRLGGRRRISVSLVSLVLNQPVILLVGTRARVRDDSSTVEPDLLSSSSNCLLLLTCKILFGWIKKKKKKDDCHPRGKASASIRRAWVRACAQVFWVGKKWKNAINLPGHLWRDGNTLWFFTIIN